MKQEVGEFASKLGKPVVTGSDSHHPLQYGCVYNTFAQDCLTINELKQAILSGSYTIHISDSLPLRVKAAKAIKKVLKENLQMSLQTVSL
ncbi:hypothetical protein O9H85_18610 [Paenibacillus filicis]|uniref:Histidinol-phosphatase n=1 Tax=Paenibacillus gyeongsangnamensis TaxID=3388067 RepID=A0ABT4QBY3_9BACL|nr:PHP-associated domain-containing protein [Paenibacillus filicis]MCZ8514397.1 hypothetical protein [Paenibacillus filicis]